MNRYRSDERKSFWFYIVMTVIFAIALTLFLLTRDEAPEESGRPAAVLESAEPGPDAVPEDPKAGE